MRRAALSLLLAGCSVPPAETPPPPGPEPVLAAHPIPEPGARTREEQVRKAEGQVWYETALAWFNKGDFDKAKEAARRAVQLDPENLAARKLLGDIHSIVGAGGPPRSVHEFRTSGGAVEQARMEIVKHVRDGRRYLAAEMHASALREFEAAELKVRAVPSLGELLPEIRAGIAASRR